MPEKAAPQNDLQVTVIVPHRGEGPALIRLLQALSKQVLPLACFEVLLIRDGQEAAPAPVPAQSDVQIRSLTLPQQAGAYAARNLGLREARGEALAFTDADCEPGPQWLVAGLAGLARSPRVAGQVEQVMSVPPTLVEQIDAQRFLRQADYVKEGFAATANLFVKKAVFDEVGLFDERLISGGDVEFGQRADDAGFGIVLEEDALVRHPCRKSWPAILKKGARVGYGVGQGLRLGQVGPDALVKRSLERMGAGQRRRVDGPPKTLPQRAGHLVLAGANAFGCVAGLVGVRRWD